MAIYIIRRRSDRVVVYRYEYPTPITGMQGFPDVDYEHVEVPPDPPPQAPAKYGGRRILSRLEFVRLFTAAEREDLYSFASNAGLTNAQKRKINVFLEDLKMAGEVNLDDADIQAGVPALQAWGLIGAGRAAEVLRG